MSHSLSRWFVTPLAAIVLASGTVALTSCTAVTAQEQRSQTLTVTGSGQISIPATIAQVSLGVEVQADTAEAAQQQVAQQSSAVVEYLRSRNVDKLQTTGIRLNPVYNTRNNETTITAYSASNIVSFRIDTEAAGEVLDTAVSRGATRINGISFVASDDAIAEARDRALTEATQDAQAQADVVLAALNLSRRSIVNITVNGSNANPAPIPYARFEAMSPAAASTPIEGGEQQINASVTLQIGY